MQGAARCWMGTREMTEGKAKLYRSLQEDSKVTANRYRWY